jgi:hypothetical protein
MIIMRRKRNSSVGAHYTSSSSFSSAFVDRCFQQQISGSLLIIGPDRSDKRILVDRILKYAQISLEDVADINGNVHSSDQEAIGTIASQLNIISSSDSHLATFESLQAHFQVILTVHLTLE